jgi:mevalonate kinase
MIPEPVRKLWSEGLRRGSFTLKLCGSGGGGYFLGLSDNWDETRETISGKGFRICPLDL